MHDELTVPTEPSWKVPPLDGFVLPPFQASSLRVVTWNVWFSPHESEQRMASLFGQIAEAAADIVCLQEVVPELAAAVRSSAALNRMYQISSNDVGPYGVIVLARHSLCASFREISLPTRMGRSLLIAEWAPSGNEEQRVAVGTVHLESLNNAPTRAAQLRKVNSALTGYARALICGDFNFDSSQNWGDWHKPSWDSAMKREWSEESSPRQKHLENDVLSATLGLAYVDVWPALHPEEEGHTFDGAQNPFVKDRQEIMRYDRILTRAMIPKSITILGAPKEVGPPLTVVPSDHYGLCATVELFG